MPTFPLVDRYMSAMLGADVAALPSGGHTIVETDKRLRRALSYGFVHALWWLWLSDGRSLVSVPAGGEAAVAGIVHAVSEAQGLDAPELATALRAAIDPLLARAGLPATDRTALALTFGCAAPQLHPWRCGDCRRLRDASIPPAEGMRLPEHCFPDGVVYGVVADERVAAVAYAHKSGIMQGEVADVGVDTAEGYRQRGYAKTAVSAVVGEYTARGGEAIYDCRPDNLASANTARSVGFVAYGRMLYLGAGGDA